MAISNELIKSFLNLKNVKYLYDPEKETFIISFTPHVLLIRLEEGGEFLQIRTLNFHQYEDGPHKETILQMIAAMNYRRKLVKFGYDPDDGEINGCIDIPIEDAELTETQFFRCVAALLEAIDEGNQRIIKILESGEDPGPNPSKMIDLLVDEIMESLEEEDMLKELEEDIDDDEFFGIDDEEEDSPNIPIDFKNKFPEKRDEDKDEDV